MAETPKHTVWITAVPTYVGRPAVTGTRSQGARVNLWCGGCQQYLLDGLTSAGTPDGPLMLSPDEAARLAREHEALNVQEPHEGHHPDGGGHAPGR